MSEACDPFAVVTAVTVPQSRWHHGEVYALLLYELAQESSEFPADLLNPAPQCFSGTSLLFNATAAHTHFFCFFSARYHCPISTRHIRPTVPQELPHSGNKENL